MTSDRTIYAVLIAVIVSLGTVYAWRWNQKSRVLDMRKQDVEVLGRVYLRNETNVTGFEDLLKLLSKAGISLNNPLSKDPSKPSYQIGSYASNHGPDDVVIEESTNVADEGSIVRLYGDGSLKLETRQQR